MDPAARDAPATRRNRDAILEVLAARLTSDARVLEVSSGTGQHAAHFGSAMPGVHWQPTEADAGAFASISAWAREARATNVAEPLLLDATAPSWSLPEPARFDAVFNANLIHIAPWEVALGLLAGTARHLLPDGQLLLYGPFLEDEVETAPSNLAFDASLRERDPRFGIRRRENVERAAAERGLRLEERIIMPANNLMLCFRRTGGGAA
ncbi:MAG: DUF938 domain-containing protein [Myxococcota bacterium]|nr:DUF938 domain-containing protein [Myxococcota bacterium]